MRLSEVSKRETRAEKERNRNQARIGFASNVIGLSAGTLGLASAMRDDRLQSKKAGPVARRVGAVGRKMPKPVQNLVDKVPKKDRPKVAGALAAGAVGLQVLNLAGDAVANRVLARSADFEKSLGVPDSHANVDAYVSRESLSSGYGRRLDDDSSVEKGIRSDSPKMKGQEVYGVDQDGRLVMRRNVTVHPDGKSLVRRRPKYVVTSIPVSSDRVTITGAANIRDRQFDNELRRKIADSSKNRKSFKYGDHDVEWVEAKKAYRRYDPEADRQRRLGLYAGLGTLGAGAGAVAGGRHLTFDLGRHPDKNVPISGSKGNSSGKKLKMGTRVRGVAVKEGKGRAAAIPLVLGTLSGAGGFAAYRQGVKERNQPWL